MPDSRPTVATQLVDRLSRCGRVGRIMGPELDMLRAAGAQSRAVLRAAAASAAWGHRVRRHVYDRIWRDAAAALGADIERHDDFWTAHRAGLHATMHYQQVMLDDAVHILISLDKSLVRKVLADAGLPTTAQVEFAADDPGVGLDFVTSAGTRCVVKPATGTSGGQGVTCGVDGPEWFARALVSARRWGTRVLAEVQAEGDELRFLVLDGAVIGGVRRRSPTVVGDGRSPIVELVAAENRRRDEADGARGMSPITIDLDCIAALRSSGRSLGTILAVDEVAAVKFGVNQSGAAGTENIRPDQLGAALLEEISQAARAVELRLASVEVVTTDPSRSLREAGGVVLEVNGMPGLHYHYLVADPAEATPVGVPILECLFAR